LGLRFRCLDPDPDAPLGRLAPHIVAPFDDQQGLERFADGLDAITYEFENVPVASTQLLAARAPVYPPPVALEVAQDRLHEKQFFARLGIPTPAFAPIATRADLDAALKRIGLPAVLKTRRMGYDGKGQVVLHAPDDVARGWAALAGQPLILEAFVPFERELSIIVVRGRQGNLVCYPLIDNQHQNGMLYRSLAPAPQASPALQREAEALGGAVAEHLGYVGVLTVELFEHEGRLLANEMAPRVHNSGHWTIEGAVCSQFENHLRALLGLPLGSTAARGTSAMLNLIGSAPDPAALLGIEGAHLHLYGKMPRPGRKLGHVTVVADDYVELERKVAALEAMIELRG
jgi:5-(carboxyamino)imidazole ribonucleotide synthase